jgi:hypothetical protein
LKLLFDFLVPAATRHRSSNSALSLPARTLPNA